MWADEAGRSPPGLPHRKIDLAGLAGNRREGRRRSSILTFRLPMKSRPPALAPAALAILCLSSCNSLDKVFEPQAPLNVEDPKAVVPADFLFTRYEPLNRWLDEAVRVQIFDVPLMDVFRQPALRELQYVVVKAPATNPPVTIDKLAMTRRQLLWAVGHDYQLHMTPAFNDDGSLSCIEIRSRSVDLPNN
jgi:hypothetical protein